MWLRCVLVILQLVQLAQLQDISQECVSLDKFEALQKELEAQKLDFKLELDALKDELHYWQNSTLSLLMKYALSEQASATNCDGRELKDDIQFLRQDISSELRNASEIIIEEFHSSIKQASNTSQFINQLEKVEEILELHDSQQDEQHEEVMDAIAAVGHVQNRTFHSPAVSCRHLKAAHPASPSGEYWIQNPKSGYASQQYCDMTRTDCGGSEGWMRIAHLDMDNPSQHCPSGFREITSPVRACGRPSGTTCVSVSFSTHGTRYRRVIGKVIGYQDKTTDGFSVYHSNRGITLDGAYVDGVSITYGQPRKRIWTFAAATDEVRSNGRVCPCTRPAYTYTGVVPPFVGNDYFCETGSRYTVHSIFYDEDPLWDKEGCGDGSTCCNGSSFFCKELPQATNEDIELRLCCSADSLTNEDVPLKLIELYIQ